MRGGGWRVVRLRDRALHCQNRPDAANNAASKKKHFLRQGCSQSEFQVTIFFSCSAECGEDFGDKT